MPFDPSKPYELLTAPVSGFDPEQPFEIIPAKAESKPITGERIAEIGGDVAAEAGGATAGQMIGLAGGPLIPFTVPIGGFIGGGVGNVIAQTRRMARGEQDGIRWGELAATAGISAFPGGQVAKGATTAARIGRSAAVMGVASAAGNLTQQAIDNPEGQPIDVGQVVIAGTIGAAGGAGVQGGIEGATALFNKLRPIFKRTPASAYEQSGPEMVNAIAKFEGIPPSEVERRFARAVNVTPTATPPPPAAQLALDDALAQKRLPAPRNPLPDTPNPPAAIEPAQTPPASDILPSEIPAPIAAEPLPAPRLPEPAPLAAPAQTSGVNQAPNAGDTITKPVVGGAPEVAPAAPTSKPAITLPDAATAQTWAQRNADRFKSIAIRENPAGGYDVFTTAKGSKLAFGARPDGTTDIIDVIQSLGGVPPPPKGATGGEWDGFGEVFGGQARILVDAKKRGTGLDQFLGNLSDTEFAHLAGNPDGFKQAVSDALADRARLKIANTLEENTAKFQTAILTGKGRGGKEPKVGKTDLSDNLIPGDKLGVKGEPLIVTGVDPDGNVTLQDGPRFGTQIIPPGVVIHPDARSMKKVPREQPRANTDPQSDDPFADNFVPEPAAPVAASTSASQELILWGRKPGTTGPEWIKLTDNTSNAEMARRQKSGWEVLRFPKGETPNRPPPTNPGEIIPTAEVPFNLASEAQDVTPSAVEAARLAEEQAAQRAANEARQGQLFGGAGTPPPRRPAPRRPGLRNNQSSGIDPQLLGALAVITTRGAGGAALGALMADNPEDRAGHAIVGGLLGAVASPTLARKIGKIAFTTTSLGRRAFPEATLPFDLREQLILKPGAVAATGHRGNVAQRALETALRKEPDPTAAAQEVWAYLTAQRPNVRPSLAAPATEARAAIDELSDKLILSGVATGNLADTINDGKGRYLRRAYRIFQSPGWKPEQSVIDDWQRTYLAANPKKTPQDAQDLVYELLDRRTAEQFVLTGSILRQNRDAFTPRKNLDAATLRLLGEITEPVELLGQTVPRMARLIETHETQKNLAAIGQKLGVFAPASDPTRGLTVQLAKAEEGAAVGPLAGLWTTPDLREALESASANFGDQSLAWRILATATTYSKFAKTVMNPESWVPNGVGAVFDGLKNGNLRIMANGPAWKDAFAVAAEDIGFNPQGAAGRATTQAIYTRMQRLGLAGQGSSADFQRGLEIAFGEAAKKGAKRAMATLGRGYAGSENVMRYMNWQAEMARYRAAFPTMPTDQLEEYAARVVRATSTNYAMIPDAVRKLSVGGALGTFVNFPYEQFRHAYNMARIAKNDIAQGAATGNAGLARAGAARMAALLTAAAGTGAVAAWSLRENGITPEQDAALRRRFPTWDRNQSLIYQGRDGDNIAYMSQSYLNPQAVLLNGLLAANRGETLEEGATNALNSAIETFAGGSVVLKPGVEALLNRTERGRQIASPEDSASRQTVDRVSYLADRAYSPGFLNSLSRIAKGYRGETGPDGQVYTVGDAVQRLFGKRINRVNLPYRFAVEAREFNFRLGEVAGSYEGVRRREVAKPEKIDQAYALAETRRQVIFKDLTRYLADANTLGYDPEKSIRWLRDGGVPAEFILSALDGRYTPGDREPTKSGRKLLDEIRAKPESERLSAFVQTVTSNPRFLDTVRTAVREQARSITEADRLIGALDTDTRAAYLRNKLATQDERTRLEYLHDLARKRLLTPDVIRAMTK